ncbi:hypothetical protein P9112_003447 [Eukaryota sp. TZLM1-RC]
MKLFVISSTACFNPTRLNFLERLLSNMADEGDRISFGYSRSDVLVSALDGSMIIIDVRSTDVPNSPNKKLAQSHNSPLRRAEEAKIINAEKINNLNSNSHTQELSLSFSFLFIWNLR